MRDAESLSAALVGCVAVVHLAASTRDDVESHDINVNGARRLVNACKSVGCRRLIVVSTLSARIARQGIYARTKQQADDIFLHSGLDVTLLYPSLVYGEQRLGMFGALQRVVEQHRLIPVLGNGRWKSAPVHISDLTRMFVLCMGEPRSIGRTYDVAGPELICFDALLDRIGDATGCGPRAKIHIPMAVALLAALLMAKFLRSPPFSVSNILGSNQDTVIDIAPAVRELGFAPITLDEGLRRMFPGSDRLVLEREARLFARYLVNTEVTPEVADRYAQAHLRRLPAPPDRLTAFVRRHTWSLGLLDAGSACSHTQSGLRKRLLLMAMVLEATPQYADCFLPRRRARIGAFAGLAWQGSCAVARWLIGFPLVCYLRERS